jgi:hypothetical protein
MAGYSNTTMSDKAPNRPHDLNQWAKRMVDIAVRDHKPTPEERGVDLAVSTLGERLAQHGAASMTPEQRREIAKKGR